MPPPSVAVTLVKSTMLFQTHIGNPKWLVRRSSTPWRTASWQTLRLLTTETAEAYGTGNRLVISRRSWQDLKVILPPKSSPSVKPKADDKPWPKSVQIAGYGAAGILIPYSIVWLITSNPSLREMVGPYLPLDKFRSHFGQLEWNVQSYVDEMQIDERKGPEDSNLGKKIPNVKFYQFPNELPFRERKQQGIIDEMEKSEIKVIIHLCGSNGHQIQETKTVPASILANAQNLFGLVKGASERLTRSTTDGTTTVAVDFEDNNAEMTVGGPLLEDVDFPPSSLNDNPSTLLLKETQTFSSWFYVPQYQIQQTGSSSATSDLEVNISRLEFTVSELQKNLKDPTCTRDMDEMATELRLAKRELFGLKWKRRLGLS